MRIIHYRFPENVSVEDRKKEGCAVVLKNGFKVLRGNTDYEEKNDLVDYIEDTISGISITRAKELLRKYGGSAVMKHIDMDGCCLETTPILLKGNNSRYKYNRYL